MRHVLCLMLGVCLLGCQNRPAGPSVPDDSMFSAKTLHLSPTFTQLKDWNGDKKPDGIEATVELQDQFGDTTRGAGKVIFELYAYRFNAPDPRGERVGGPWIGSLLTRADQVAHWSSAIRAYTFDLAQPGISKAGTYVLTAEFDFGSRHLFDQVILEGTEFNRRLGSPTIHAAEQAPSH